MVVMLYSELNNCQI